MSSKRATFELQVLRSKNWTVKDIYDDEATAQTTAEKELKANRAEGVRIIRCWRRADGVETEKVVFEKMGVVKPLRDVRIIPIEDANFCADAAAILSADSMKTAGHLFRKYLDEMQITPMEVLHVYREYKRLWDTENILVSGVDRLALIQTRNTEITVKTRTEDLYRLIEGIGQRARRTEGKKHLPRTIAGTLGAVLGGCAAFPEDDLDARFSANQVLARDLLEHRSLIAKLARLGDLLEPETDAEATTLLDAVVAQVFASPAVLQEALGPKANLAEAILSLVDILESGPTGFDAMLPHGALFLEGIRSERLPLLRAEVFGRMVSMVSGTNPLSRNEPKNETAAFADVANRLVTADSILGETNVAKALHARACLFVVEGGAIGRKLGVEWLLRVLKTVPQRLCVLKALDQAYAGDAELRAAGFAQLQALILGSPSATAFATAGGDMIAPMRTITGLYHWLAATYPAPVVAPLQAHLDGLVTKYLEDKAIIERMDRQDLPLADRATMLLTFMLSGNLTEGLAMDMARTRVRDHLKRPDFVTAFADDCPDPGQRERRLREFYALLSRAGFSVRD